MWKFRRLQGFETFLSAANSHSVALSGGALLLISLTAHLHNPPFPLNDKTFDFSSEAGKKFIWTSNSKHEKTFC